MVGFGSSLRIGRRAGWEAAYLDYESLKLLLSQIESVYEEEGHQGQHQTRDNIFVGGGEATMIDAGDDDDSTSPRKQRKRHQQQRTVDFRDELFLEWDSDVAFASNNSKEDDDDVSSSELSDYEKDPRHHHQYHRNDIQNAISGTNNNPFTMMYSQDVASSSDDSYSGMEKNNCGGVPWRKQEKKPAKSTSGYHHLHQRKKNKAKMWYNYEARDTTGLDTFIMDEESESFNPMDRQQQKPYTSSLLNAPFQLGVSTESTALLSHSNQSQNVNSFFSFDHGNSTATLTPPRADFYGKEESTTTTNASQSLMYGGGSSSVSNFLSSQKSSSPKGLKPKAVLLEEERRRARRQRRRRKRARKRREREKRVPRHIRIAHSKSRAITERFLGLLRAEVEKITLFAQARLGELADTAGSLRFLSSEELTELSGKLVGRPNTSTYEHQLSDGGIHPSASSSSDEGAGGQGSFPWSDSSSDDDASQNSSRLNIPKNVSGGNLSKAENRNTGDSIMRARSISPVKHLAKEQTELLKSTRRKIEHFENIRRKRPIFQRNDHIVGEDLLLVSAVDEADAYCAVGVELMHILKYICVNVIAVRKICRKHDKLLMNRMLGGYYHRKRTTRAQDEQTLGHIIAHVAGDIPHPALMGLGDHGKLVNVYDLKIQHLANSRTVKVVSSCLALALSEYEVSRSRAETLARINTSSRKPPASSVAVLPIQNEGSSSPLRVGSFDLNPRGWAIRGNSDHAAASRQKEAIDNSNLSDDENGPPSTASSISLTRLRFTVLLIAALREASRFKLNHFTTYLSRTSLAFTGQAVIGEGLDGSSRETLDFFLSFCPDAALLLDSSELFEGLRRGKWRELSVGSVMRSSLAVALLNTPSQLHESQAQKRYIEEESVVMNAVSLLPQSEGIDISAPLEGAVLSISTSMSISRFVDFPPSFIRINRTSLFLYTVNYYIIHATVNTFVLDTGANVAYSAAIVGAANFSSIIAAIIQYSVFAKTGRHTRPSSEIDFAPVRKCLAYSSVAAIIGNLLHIHGIEWKSISFAVLGRFVMGFAAADIVHRQVATLMPPSLVVPEAARLVQMQVIGMITGLFLGSLVELLPFRTTVDPTMLLPVGSMGKMDGVKSLKVANWLMCFLWTIQFFRVMCVGRGKSASVNGSRLSNMNDDSNHGAIDNPVVEQNDSDSSTSDGETGPAELFRRPEEIIEADSNSVDSGHEQTAPGNPTRAAIKLRDVNDGRRRKTRKVGNFLKRIRRVVPYNIAVSVALALTVFTAFGHEVLFTSCALIADQYFQWRGSIAGVFLGSLSVLILPIDFVCEQIARRYEERTIIRRSILLLGVGLLVMVNWGSVFALAVNVSLLLTETKDTRQHHYDWLLGIPQYTIGFSVTFVGLRALGGASRSLLSKVSPYNVKGAVTNLGTVVTFLSLLSQFLANAQITMVGLSHRVINTDIVNALVVPMLIGCLVAYYFVQKHYFFLM